MRSKFESVLKEPLIHFLIFGALLYVLHSVLQPSGDATGGEIVVTDAQVQTMVKIFMRTWQRPPTVDELDGLVDDYIRTEVLVREAMALGLDRGDTIIRRRLRQKMEFFTETGEDKYAPTDGQLGIFLEAHSDQYLTDGTASFQHIFFDTEKRQGKTEADARSVLLELRENPDVPAYELLGDSLMVIKPEWDNVSRSQVTALFGGRFAEALFALEPGDWAGPIASAYGLHLVYVDAMTAGRLPTVDEIRTELKRDFEVTRRREKEEAFYQGLLSKYRVMRPDLSLQ
jgi:hypothetical protein